MRISTASRQYKSFIISMLRRKQAFSPTRGLRNKPISGSASCCPKSLVQITRPIRIQRNPVGIHRSDAFGVCEGAYSIRRTSVDCRPGTL